jgi:hypothetical protein
VYQRHKITAPFGEIPTEVTPFKPIRWPECVYLLVRPQTFEKPIGSKMHEKFLSLSALTENKCSCSRVNSNAIFYDVKLHDSYHLSRAPTSLIVGHVSCYTQISDRVSLSAPAGNTVLNSADEMWIEGCELLADRTNNLKSLIRMAFNDTNHNYWLQNQKSSTTTGYLVLFLFHSDRGYDVDRNITLFFYICHPGVLY